VQTDNQETKQEQVSDATQTSIAGGTGRKGGQGKGKRGQTARPDGTPNPDKKIKQRADGRYQYKDPHTGKKKIKPPDWKPSSSEYSISRPAEVAIGTALIIGGCVLGLANLIEDVGTGGAGLVDDPVLVPLSVGIVTTGVSMVAGKKDEPETVE